MRFEDIAGLMIEKCASDVFIKPDNQVRFRVAGKVVVSDILLSEEQVTSMVDNLLDLKLKKTLDEKGSAHFAVNFSHSFRFRIVVFYQQNKLAIIARSIQLNVPAFKDLNLPFQVLENLSREKRGMVLLTGTMGSGKSTSIASMIEFINRNTQRHILTIEDPIEFTFEDKKSIINQREIGKDVPAYSDALVQFTLQSPDVIYIGTIVDLATCRAALAAAETGVLVISTLHTVDASQTIERLVNFFLPHQHAEVAMQLSYLLKGVISLRLVPLKGQEAVIPAYEVMTLSPSISRLIRERKTVEIPTYLEEGGIYNMIRFDTCLYNLVKEGKIDARTAIDFTDHKDELTMRLSHEGLI